MTWFTLAAGLDPNCVECHYNVGVAYSAPRALGRPPSAHSRTLSASGGTTPPPTTGWPTSSRDRDAPRDAAAARGEATRLTLAALEAGRRQAAEDVARGIAFLEAGNVEDARQRFEDAAGRSPGYAPAYYWLGVALTEIGRSGPALTALRRAVSLDGSGEHAADARSRIAALER